jgi:D-glycero-alpha-D-manno-heptose-7-phosphate kinase
MSEILEDAPVEASAPCRVDIGGTIDISTFYLPLRHLGPCTFNIALNLRTTVRLSSYHRDIVRVESRGFDPAEFPVHTAPYVHPLGLVFAVADYFNAGGVRIEIDSASPPRSALGGSSVAAVALIAALSRVLERVGGPSLSRDESVRLAHSLEASVARVPCGLQDQLAAAYGGIHAWYWPGEVDGPIFRRESVVSQEEHRKFGSHLIVAYCGVPHLSKDINGRWVAQFLSGKTRQEWEEIVRNTRQFISALRQKDFPRVVETMNKETDLRRRMTPDVLDDLGIRLVDSARSAHCGAKFAGAGGGGCIWALGTSSDIDRLRDIWSDEISVRREARLLHVNVDSDGLLCKL